MAHPTLEYIRGLRKTLETKKAEIVGESPSSIPGSEHDGKPDPAAKQPDPETNDETMVPNTGLTTDGAGDDSKITHMNDLVAGEVALTPTKKPEVTGDAEAKTAEALAAEILTGVDAWFAAKKEAEAQKQAEEKTEAKSEPEAKKEAADTPPAAGEGTAEALITDNGKEPEQTKDIIEPNKKDEVTTDAMVPATGEGSSGETAAAAKEAADGKEAECCKDGKCGKCAKCKAAKCKSAKKCAGALDMELTSDVLAKIAAVMLATEEGTKLAEDVLAKAAGAEAAEKTLNFLRAQNELAQKQAEYKAGQRDALALILKKAQECGGECKEKCDGGECGDCGSEGAATAADDGGVTEIANTLDEMVEAGEITEDEADQVVVEIAQALSAGDTAQAPVEEKKEAQAVDPAAGADAGNAAIDAAVSVPPEQLDPNSVPQGDLSDVTPEDVASAIDTLVQSGEITEDEADQLVADITGAAGDAGEAGDTGAAGAEGAEGTDVSPEEIATALQQAVDSGEISPEDVQQVLTELEGTPAPDAGAGAAEPAAAAAPDAAAVAPVDEPKTAGAKLLAAISAARTAKTAAAKEPQKK